MGSMSLCLGHVLSLRNIAGGNWHDLMRAWLFVSSILQLMQMPIRTRFLHRLVSAGDEDIHRIILDFTRRSSWRICKVLLLLSYTWLVLGYILLRFAKASVGDSLLVLCYLEIAAAGLHAGVATNFCRCTSQERRSESRPVCSRGGLSRTEIDRLPTVRFTPGMLGDDSSCSVCLGDYTAGAVLRRLPCGHHFHGCCADKWLKRSTLCPLCRGAVDGPVGACHLDR